MRKGPTASARPSVQGGRSTPSPKNTVVDDYYESRPSILSLYLVIFLTVSLIGGLATALFFAYAHEVEKRPPSTKIAATTAAENAASVPQPVSGTATGLSTSAATTAKASGAARRATRHLPRDTSSRPSRRTKKRRRRKRPPTLSYTSSSEKMEGSTTAVEEMGRERIAKGVGRPEIDGTKVNTTTGTVANESQSTPERPLPSRTTRADAAGLSESSSTEETTTLGEPTNDTTMNATTSVSSAATPPDTSPAERTGRNRDLAASGADDADSTSRRSGLIDVANPQGDLEEETDTTGDGGNETDAAVAAQTTPLEEWTKSYDESPRASLVLPRRLDQRRERAARRLRRR